MKEERRISLRRQHMEYDDGVHLSSCLDDAEEGTGRGGGIVWITSDPEE